VLPRSHSSFVPHPLVSPSGQPLKFFPEIASFSVPPRDNSTRNPPPSSHVRPVFDHVQSHKNLFSSLISSWGFEEILIPISPGCPPSALMTDFFFCKLLFSCSVALLVLQVLGRRSSLCPSLHIGFNSPSLEFSYRGLAPRRTFPSIAPLALSRPQHVPTG